MEFARKLIQLLPTTKLLPLLPYLPLVESAPAGKAQVNLLTVGRASQMEWCALVASGNQREREATDRRHMSSVYLVKLGMQH